MSIVEAWAQLRAEGRDEPGWHARRVYTGSPCDIRAALRAPEATMAVLFEVPARAVPPGVDFPTCVGFELALETISPGPGGRVRLCLLLRSNRYREVFSTLAEDVGAIVSTAENDLSGVKLLLGRLRTWERFVSKFGPDLLSEEKQIGLFAELRFLLDEVLAHTDAASALRAWRGPFGEPHDFRFRAAAVEIKATCARDPQTFSVSNLRQLDAEDLEALLVQHVTFELVATGGQSLPEAVAEARAGLSSSDPAAAADLDRSLMEVGYIDLHAPSYDRRYRATSVRWFAVETGFPRLTHSTVPDGITSVSYSVSLQACSPYALDVMTAVATMRAKM